GTGIARWNELLGSETGHERTRRALFEAAQRHLATHTARMCPLCGQPVSLEVLRTQVTENLQDLESKSGRFRDVDAGLLRLVSEVRAVDAGRNALARSAAALGVALPRVPTAPDRELAHARDEQKPADAEAIAAYV